MLFPRRCLPVAFLAVNGIAADRLELRRRFRGDRYASISVPARKRADKIRSGSQRRGVDNDILLCDHDVQAPDAASLPRWLKLALQALPVKHCCLRRKIILGATRLEASISRKNYLFDRSVGK
jgi:hypothetical protein